MKLKNQRQGFTLLEIIIVIIIVGVLASLALPRFFALIESSRQTEALVNITSIRQALERVYIMQTTSGNTLDVSAGPPLKNPGPIDHDKEWNQLGIDDPGLSPNSHFLYTVEVAPVNGSIVVLALRNCRDNGNPGGEPPNLIFLGINYVTNQTDLCGFGNYQSLKMGEGNCGNWENWYSKYGDLIAYNRLIVSLPGCP